MTAIPKARTYNQNHIARPHTGGRRIEASVLLGMGRNTLTRKIQELGLGEEAGREK